MLGVANLALGFQPAVQQLPPEVLRRFRIPAAPGFEQAFQNPARALAPLDSGSDFLIVNAQPVHQLMQAFIFRAFRLVRLIQQVDIRAGILVRVLRNQQPVKRPGILTERLSQHGRNDRQQIGFGVPRRNAAALLKHSFPELPAGERQPLPLCGGNFLIRIGKRVRQAVQGALQAFPHRHHIVKRGHAAHVDIIPLPAEQQGIRRAEQLRAAQRHPGDRGSHIPGKLRQQGSPRNFAVLILITFLLPGERRRRKRHAGEHRRRDGLRGQLPRHLPPRFPERFAVPVGLVQRIPPGVRAPFPEGIIQ